MMRRLNFLILCVIAFVSANCQSAKISTLQTSCENEEVALDDIVVQVESQLLMDYYGEMEDVGSNVESLFIGGFESEKIDYSVVQPILKANCYDCHNKKGTAPFSLMNYETVKKKSRAIADVLKYGIMPPWTADTSYSHFVNAPKMSNYDKSVVIHWTENGCVLGKEGGVSELKIEVPFVSVPASEIFEITSNEDAYHYTVFDPKLSDDLRVSFIDYTQSSLAIVHHRTLFIDTTGRILDEGKSQKELDVLLNQLVPFTAWSKGMIPTKLTDNFYWNAPEGSKFMLQTHYQGDGNIGQTDEFSLNLYESTSNGHRINFGVNNNFEILYKANEISTERVSMYVEDSISVTGIIPHMHYLVKKLECYTVVGETKINLLKIPKWDYYYQGQYILDKPITIPAGATIYLSVVVDNSDKNVFQPNDPIRDVIYAQSSKDEMLTLVVLHTDGPIDENLKIAEKFYK